MTESEWLSATDTNPMLEFALGKATKRKPRLFMVACCRRVWHLLTDERSRDPVLVAERHADGDADGWELRAAEKAARRATMKALKTAAKSPYGEWAASNVTHFGVPVKPASWGW